MASHALGCAFRFVFSFLTGLTFRNPQNSVDYFRFRGTHAEIKSFPGKINLFRNPTESGIPAGIPEGRTLDMVSCATCNEHSLRRQKKQVSTMAFFCQLLLLPRTTASRYCCRHCCHCLSRGSSGGAGVAACGGSSSSSSSGGSSGGSGGSGGGGSGGGSSVILFLVIVVILLLFACPLLVGIIPPLFTDGGVQRKGSKEKAVE